MRPSRSEGNTPRRPCSFTLSEEKEKVRRATDRKKRKPLASAFLCIFCAGVCVLRLHACISCKGAVCLNIDRGLGKVGGTFGARRLLCSSQAEDRRQ